MMLTPKQWSWSAMIGAAMLAFALSGCTTVRYLPPLPEEWSAPAIEDGAPCITDGQPYLSCPPRA